MSNRTENIRAAAVADRNAGMTYKAIATKHGVSMNSVKKWYRMALEANGVTDGIKPRITYTPEQRAHILEDHYTSGRSVNASSRLHGIDDKTLSKWIRTDDTWREDGDEVDMTAGRWVLCPRRRVHVWDSAA